MSRIVKEGVLSRWSRLKRESVPDAGEAETSPDHDRAEEAIANSDDVNPSANEEEIAKPLPSLDELGPDSDFQGFMKPGVDDGLRRAALKKLFGDPHFNVTDGLDVYAEDYTKLESMTPAMVAGLKHTKRLLFGDSEEKQSAETTATPLRTPENDERLLALQKEEQGEQVRVCEEEVKEPLQNSAEDEESEIVLRATKHYPKED